MSVMYTTCNGDPINLSGIFNGSCGFLVVNGPRSMARIDKEKLYLPGVLRMCVNNGSKAVRPNLWTCVDPPDRFLKSVYFDPAIMKFIPKGFCGKRLWDTENDCPLPEKLVDAPNVYQYARNSKFHPEKFFKTQDVTWGLGKGQSFKYGGKGTKGVRSCMLVALRIMVDMGMSHIFLVGCDFYMDPKKPYSFDEQKHAGGCQSNNNSYRGLNIIFSALCPHLEEMGIGVYNTYRESGLRAFDYVPFDEAIEFATRQVGDTQSERTSGMYAVRKRVANKKKEVKEHRILTGLYTPEGRVLSHGDAMLRTVDVDVPPSVRKRVVKVGAPVMELYTVEQSWDDRERLVSIYPVLKELKGHVQKRLDGIKGRGKRCKGCGVTRAKKSFYNSVCSAIMEAPELVVSAGIMTQKHTILRGNTRVPLEGLINADNQQ